MVVEAVAGLGDGTAGGPPRILTACRNEENKSCRTHTHWRNAPERARASLRSTTLSSSAPGFPACICPTARASWAWPRGAARPPRTLGAPGTGTEAHAAAPRVAELAPGLRAGVQGQHATALQLCEHG